MKFGGIILGKGKMVNSKHFHCRAQRWGGGLVIRVPNILDHFQKQVRQVIYVAGGGTLACHTTMPATRQKDPIDII